MRGEWARVMMTALAAAAAAEAGTVRVAPVVSFGIVTDVHYADAPAEGTRVYRDSTAKVGAAVATFNTEGVNFVMSLGDFKDTAADKGCAQPNVPPPNGCVNLTVGFLSTIEAVLARFNGPRYHVLGNHDVDVLTQEDVLGAVQDSAGAPPGSAGGAGYSSWSAGSNGTAPPPGTAQPDDAGCLVREADSSHNIWVVHNDGTRNWLSASTAHPEWGADAAVVSSIDAYPKRDGGNASYNLDATASAAAVAQRCAAGNCRCDPATGAANRSTLPQPTSSAPIRFIRLNADFTDHDVPWADLDNAAGPGAVPGMAWSKANVPSFQLTWLASELDAAAALGQHVIVFVHYRVDGGPGGPVGTGLGPSSVPSRAWVDDCTLQNAAVVRDVLEKRPGLVLAVFSGHDHVPQPPYTKQTATAPLYFTHHATVEGALPHNAYSVVDVLPDCTINVRGFVDATSATIPGPPGHSCGSTR